MLFHVCLCPFGCLACRLVFIFPNISACVGLLVSGCCFSGYYSNSNAFRSGWGHFLYLRLSFDMHGASTLALWRKNCAPWEHPGGPWEQQAGHMRVLKQMLADLGATWVAKFLFFRNRRLNNLFFQSCFQIVVGPIFESKFTHTPGAHENMLSLGV